MTQHLQLSGIGYREDFENIFFEDTCINCQHYHPTRYCGLTNEPVSPLATCSHQDSIQKVNREDVAEVIRIKGESLSDTEWDTLSNISAADFIEVAEGILEE